MSWHYSLSSSLWMSIVVVKASQHLKGLCDNLYKCSWPANTQALMILQCSEISVTAKASPQAITEKQ